MKKRWFIVLLVMTILLAGCAKASPKATMDYPYAAPAMGAPQMEFDEAKLESSQAEDQSNVPSERMVVKTASLKVAVVDPAKSVNEVSALANRLGGYVVSSNTWESGYGSSASYVQSEVTIRVPSEKLDEALAQIRSMAADVKSGVIFESISGQDVTSEYVDAESQLKNLQAAEKQLLELLDRTAELEDTMEVFRELTSIRGRIETIQGRMKYLRESSSLSMITAQFISEASFKPIEIGGWKAEGTAREALQALINTAQDVADGFIWFGIYCLPFLIPIGIVLYFAIKAIVKRRAKRRKNAPVVKAEELPQDEPKP